MGTPETGDARGARITRASSACRARLLRPLASDDTRARFWVRHVQMGVALSEVAAVLVMGYVLVAARPNAVWVLLIAVAVAVCSPMLLWVPMERTSRTLAGPLLFYLWSLVVTAVVVAATLLDGGADSPLVWLFLLTMTFAALAYPPWGVILVGLVMVAGFGLVVVIDAAMTVQSALVAAVLATFTVMTAWISANLWNTYDEQLRLSARLAELDRAREEFVAATSHEVRTPVASILGYLELLEDLDPPSTGSGVHLAAIRRNAERLNDLAEDLLVLSSWSAEQPRRLGVPSDDHADLVAVLRGVGESMAPLARRNEVTLVLPTPGRPLVVAGSSHYLEKVVLNLVGNAVKYSPGGGTVRCGLQAADHEVALTVSDEGIGIAEEDLEQVFTRFYRAQSARDAGIGGSGLGLHIVRDVLAGYGGTVAVTSILGAGTTFTVRLPLAEATAAGLEGRAYHSSTLKRAVVGAGSRATADAAGRDGLAPTISG